MNQGYRYWNDDDRDVNDTIHNYSREGLDECIILNEYESIINIIKKTKCEGLASYFEYNSTFEKQGNVTKKNGNIKIYSDTDSELFIENDINISDNESSKSSESYEDLLMNENITHHTNKFATS